MRVHSVFSRGLGAVSVYENASYSFSKGLPAMALCDLHSIIGWESFFQQALKQGLKPMLGLEIRLQEMGTLLIFPRNDCGFYSLTHSLNHRVFSRYSDLLVVFISTDWSLSRVAAVLDRLKGIVKPENLYIGLEWGTKREVVLQAQHYAIPLVWAQPLKYVKNPQKFVVARSIFNHHSITENLNCMSRGEIPLFGPITAGAIFKRWHKLGKEAMKNTFDLAAKVCFKFDAGSCAPDYTSPSSRQRLTEMVKRKMVQQGYCRREKIYFNSRGSAASSFILFLLGLSQVNPLNHQLIFERFINRYRDDLPDIDIDIDSSRRPQVLEWLFGVFPGKVSFVSSHKFFGARSALYGVARCFGFDVEDAHRMSREMPMFASPDELRGQGTGKLNELYRYASLLQGVFKELSIHIGGVVFSGEENRQTFPLEKSPAGFDQVVWDKDTIRRLKIFKLDLLGVRSFEVIAPVAAPGTVDFEDTEAWKNIRTARTIGCFQLESPLARDSLLKVKPQTLRQLAITIAVIRPGPARCGMRSSYLNPPDTNHPLLKQLFPHSRGAIIFEEQITLLLQAVSGWCLERAEKVRKDIKSGAGRTYKQQFMERGIEWSCSYRLNICKMDWG